MTGTGARYMAEALDGYGTSAVFFVPTMLSKTLYELEQRTSVSRIMTHGEKAAVYMADGYARASGRPGICFSQAIGASNLCAGLRDPFLAGSPVIAMSGGPYPWSRGRAQYQEIEDRPAFKTVTKLSESVDHVDRLPDMLRRAFQTATVGRPGPVHLELAGHKGELIEAAPLEHPAPHDQFSTPRYRPRPPSDQIRRAASRLSAAQRPVLVAGNGVRVSGGARLLVELAEELHIPVATSLHAKAVVPASHPLSLGVPGLYARQCANEAILDSDLVVYVGSGIGSQLTLNWTIPNSDTPIIQVDIEPSQLTRHYPHITPVLGDASAVLTELLEATRGLPLPPEREAWVRRAESLRRHWESDVAASRHSEATPLVPERVMHELSLSLPEHALVVADTGHAGMWMGGWLDLDKQHQGFIRAAGSLGWGLPAALGAKVAAPDRPVVLFTGDGGFWYHLAEIETAVRYNIGAVLVVNNNSSLSQEFNSFTAAYNGKLHGRHEELWHFTEVDFARVAEAMGAKGLRVTRPGQLQSALEEALAHEGPTVIDVVTDLRILAPKGKAERSAIA